MLEDLHRFQRGFLQRDASMRALWSDRPNCSHNVSQKVKRIRHLSEVRRFFARSETAYPRLLILDGGNRALVIGF